MSDTPSRDSNTLRKIIIRHARMPVSFKSTIPVYVELDTTNFDESKREVFVSCEYEPIAEKICPTCGHMGELKLPRIPSMRSVVRQDENCKKRANNAWK